MAYDVIHKNSTVTGTPPTAGEIEVGEIAINAADAELYTKDTAGNIRKFQNTTTGTAAGVQFTQAGTGAEQRTVESKLRDIVSVLDFIPNSEHAAIKAGSSTYDCSSDIQAAFDYAASTTDRVYIPAGIYKIGTGLTCQCNLIGDGRKVSILQHDGATPITLLSITAHQQANIFDIGLWGAGTDASGSWKTYCLLDVNSTTRGWECNRVEIGRYGVSGYGAEWGMRIDGFAYYKAVINTVFDYNKHSAYLASSGNSFGRQFIDCRFEHGSSYAEVVLGAGGRAKFTNCAFQFGQGGGVTTQPNSVDEINKIISGNTASASFSADRCTFERENRGGWQYVLDGVNTEVGHAQVLNGSCVIEDCFFTGIAGESAQAVLIDTGSCEIVSNSTSSSYVRTFLRAGNGLTGATLEDNRASGGAVTTQYNLNNTAIEISTGKNTFIYPAFYGSNEYTKLNGVKHLILQDGTIDDDTTATVRIDLPNGRESFRLKVTSQPAYTAYGGAAVTSFDIEFFYFSQTSDINYSIISTAGNTPTVDATNVALTGGYILVSFTTTRASTGTDVANLHTLDVSGAFSAVSIS